MERELTEGETLMLQMFRMFVHTYGITLGRTIFEGLGAATQLASFRETDMYQVVAMEDGEVTAYKIPASWRIDIPHTQRTRGYARLGIARQLAEMVTVEHDRLHSFDTARDIVYVPSAADNVDVGAVVADVAQRVPESSAARLHTITTKVQRTLDQDLYGPQIIILN